MSDRKPIIIAVAVGTLALTANGAAVVVALAAAAPPQATAFGIIGLSAAFIGLIATILWAWRDEVTPQQKRGRVFTPWVQPEEGTEAYMLPGPSRRSSLALAAVPAQQSSPLTVATIAAAATPAPVAEAQVIDLRDWLKSHRPEHALA